MVDYAVKKSRNKKQTCKICGKKKVEAHHKDYSKPLDVVWLCHKHHMDEHFQIRAGARVQQLNVGLAFK